MNQLIENAFHQIEQIGNKSQERINTATISNNLKYIASGGEDKILRIWDYQTNNEIRNVRLYDRVLSCKFTDDCKFLYVGTDYSLIQFIVLNRIKRYKNKFQWGRIINIYCITNTTILASFENGIINQQKSTSRQSLFSLKAHNNQVQGLDYDKNSFIIACASLNGSIKLWNEKNRSLYIQKLNAHNNNQIYQVLFFNSYKQLISLDFSRNIKIWNINHQQRQLEQNQLLLDAGYNMSLVLNEQYIVTVGQNFIKIYTINGQLIRQIDHEIDDFYWYNTVQLDSIMAILIKGYQSTCLQISDALIK